MFNQLAGINAILYYVNNIFASAGFSQISSDQQSVGIGATLFTFTIVGMEWLRRLPDQANEVTFGGLRRRCRSR